MIDLQFYFEIAKIGLFLGVSFASAIFICGYLLSLIVGILKHY